MGVSVCETDLICTGLVVFKINLQQLCSEIDHQEPPSLSEEGLWNPLDSQGLAHAPCAHAGALCILREHPSASCRSLPGSLLITEADPVVSSSRWQDQELSLDSPRCPDDWADDPAFQVHKELSPTSTAHLEGGREKTTMPLSLQGALHRCLPYLLTTARPVGRG